MAHRDDVFQTNFSEFAALAVSTPLDLQLEPVVVSRPLIASMMADEIAILVSILATLKELSRTPKSKRPTSVQHADTSDSVNVSKPNQQSVVLIGCGGVGNIIATRLLSGKVLHPTSLHIMTRQPQMLSKLSKSGCRCGVVHSPSIESADVVIIATLPGQLSVVSQQIQGHLKSSAVVLSVCAGISSDKLCTELRHPLCMSVSADNVSGVSRIADQIDIRLPLRPQCVVPLIDCMFPFVVDPHQHQQTPAASLAQEQQNSLLSTSHIQKGSFVEEGTVEVGAEILVTKQLRSKVYRLVYVLAASATAGGLPFHEATFAVWGLMSSRRSQSKWVSIYSDHACPGSGVSNSNGDTEKEAAGSGDVFDPVRFSFATGMHFSKLVGVSERHLLLGFRERLQLFLTSLPTTTM